MIMHYKSILKSVIDRETGEQLRGSQQAKVTSFYKIKKELELFLDLHKVLTLLDKNVSSLTVEFEDDTNVKMSFNCQGEVKWVLITRSQSLDDPVELHKVRVTKVSNAWCVTHLFTKIIDDYEAKFDVTKFDVTSEIESSILLYMHTNPDGCFPLFPHSAITTFKVRCNEYPPSKQLVDTIKSTFGRFYINLMDFPNVVHHAK